MSFSQWLALSAIRTTFLTENNFLSEKDIEQLAVEQGLAPWTFVGGVYGSSRQVKAHKAEIAKYLSSLGELVFIGDTSEKLLNSIVRGVRKPGVQGAFYKGLKSISHLFVSRLSVEMMESLLSVYPFLKGEPNESILALAYFKNKERQPKQNLDPARDECGLIWFAPILPARGKEIQSFVQNIKQVCAGNQFETAVSLIQVNPRTFLVLVPLFFSKKDLEEAARAQKLMINFVNFLKHITTSSIVAPHLKWRDSWNAILPINI